MSNKMSLQFDGFTQMMKELEQLSADTKSIADKALEKTFEIVTEKAKDAANPANYPAKGKYSQGRTAESLQETCKIYWRGTEASVDVGYSIKAGGLQSIFMIYGTPRYMKVQKMYDAFFGKKTIDEIQSAQRQILLDAMREYLQ